MDAKQLEELLNKHREDCYQEMDGEGFEVPNKFVWSEEKVKELLKKAVNASLEEAAEKAIDAIEENESNLESVSLNAIAEGLKNIKESILSLKR